MLKKENKIENGFTMVELMIVIAIIGIMAGVVTVSMKGSVDKSKEASAITTLSSVLPELVTCADDNGLAKSSAPVAGDFICCKLATACGGGTATNAVDGHLQTWKDINTKTDFNYFTVSNSLSTGNYEFTARNTTTRRIITCKYADNECTIASY